MIQTVSSQDARERFDALLDSVREKNETVVLEINGEPVAVMISPDDYRQLIQLKRERVWRALDQVRDRNAGADPDEVLELVNEVVKEVRRERRERPLDADQNRR